MISYVTKSVVDTNVVVSGLIFPGSVAWQALQRVMRESELLVSSATVEELHLVLLREKFDRYVSRELRAEAVEEYLNHTRMVSIQSRVSECRDPRDDKFLELALSGEAELILTGDDDLLAMHPWRGISILSPGDYLALG